MKDEIQVLNKILEGKFITPVYQPIASLTKGVGISTGSFYRLYDTKEELFFEVFSEFFGFKSLLIELPLYRSRE